jgi:hypothetical protein
VNSILVTTIESNRNHGITKAPDIEERIEAMEKLKKEGAEIMITIELVMDFDLEKMVKIIKLLEPDYLNIGADSGGNKLPEPSKEKLMALLEQFNFHQKKNLNRLLNK